MDVEQAVTLARNCPDVLLALLKRMTRAERANILKQFEAEYPKEFKAWYVGDVKAYLKAMIRT